MKVLLVLAVVLAVALALDVKLPLPRKVLGTENTHVTPDWTDEGVASSSAAVQFRLFFYLRNLDRLDEIYEDRINPNSPNYRQWMSREEIFGLVGPSQLAKKHVTAWLKRNGVDAAAIKDNGEAFVVDTTAEIASKLFETEFHQFVSAKNGKTILRQVGEYSLPVSISRVVEFVSGITSFPVNKRLSAHARAPEDNQQGKIVPYVINELYSIPTVSPVFNSSVCLAEFQDDRSFAASDLSDFQTENDLPNNPVYKIVGPYSPSIPDAESTLDVQYGSGVAVNSSVWFWTVDGWMAEFANDFLSTPVVPFVVSMSWGWTETDQCQITSCNGLTSEQYVARVNTQFQMIGLRGVTLYASSGDQGAPGDGDPYCINTKQPISAIFPGASPYVTSVGATMLTPTSSSPSAVSGSDASAPPICSTYDCANPDWPEVACSYPDALITSGGGFSSYSPRPSWQNTVVNAYLQKTADLPPASTFNASNRGFPDVSALGHNYLIRLSGRWTIVDGTSCSSPVWAGMTGLWNDILFAAGKPSLGPVNPLLYQMYSSSPSTFKDITSGNNKCTESSCCKDGYTATTGWDAVTGLGVPNFQAITNYIQANLIN